jgi:hypothetical protein
MTAKKSGDVIYDGSLLYYSYLWELWLHRAFQKNWNSTILIYFSHTLLT